MENPTVMLQQIGNVYFQAKKNSKLNTSFLRISVLVIVSPLAFLLLSGVLPSPFLSFLGARAPCAFMGLPWFRLRSPSLVCWCSFVGAVLAEPT